MSDDYVRDPLSGLEHTVKHGDYRFTGSVEVAGSLTHNGAAIGGGTYQVPTGATNGSNRAFTFTAPPKLIFRNGVMERRLGSISGNVFTFDAAPDSDDDIEGLV